MPPERITHRQVATRAARTPAKPQVAPPQAGRPIASAGLVDNLQVARPADILSLQRQVGNRAVESLFARHALQPKLTVGPAGDHYEQEADRVAAQVLSMPAPPARPPRLQRTTEEDEETNAQAASLTASIAPPIRRQAEGKDEALPAKALVEPPAAAEPEAVQARPRNPAEGFEAGSAIEGQLRREKGNGRPLSAGVRSYMEPRFGASFSGVRIHADGPAAQLNRQLSAQAFTHGADIYFGAGQYSPASGDGQRLLAHELAHVVQQGATQRLAGPDVQRLADDPGPSEAVERTEPEGKVGPNSSFFQKAGAWLKQGFGQVGAWLQQGFGQVKQFGKRFYGRLEGGGAEKEKTGTAFLDEKAPKEQLEYAQKTKGSHEATQPDYVNRDLLGQEPNRFQVTLAVSQEDPKWLTNITALRNAALGQFLVNPVKMLGKIVSGDAAALQDTMRVVLSKTEKDWPKKDKDEQNSLIEDFTEGLHNVGHTWVRLSAYVGNKLKRLYTFGMWPRKTYDPARAGEVGGYAGLSQPGPGEVRHPDVVHEGDAQKVYYDTDVSAEGFERALATAARRYASPPAYVLMGYNCTAFAREILRKAGGSFPGRGLLPGVAFTPGFLYAAILKEWNKGRRGARLAEKYPQVVKQVAKEQTEREKAGREEAQSAYTLKKYGTPAEGAPEIKVKLMGGRVVNFGVKPDKLDRQWKIETDVMVIKIDDAAFIKRWKAVPTKYEHFLWYVARDAFEAATSKMIGYEYSDDTPPTLQTAVAQERFSAQEAMLLFPMGRSQAGWTHVMHQQTYDNYWVRSDEYDAFLGQRAGEYEQPKPGAQRTKVQLHAGNDIWWGVLPDKTDRKETLDKDQEVTAVMDDDWIKKYKSVPVEGYLKGYVSWDAFQKARVAPVKPTPAPKETAPEPETKTETVKPGFYKLSGEQEKFNIIDKVELKPLLVLDRGAVVEALGPDPDNELLVRIRFTQGEKKQEGRIAKDSLLQAESVPAPKEGTGQSGQPVPGGTSEGRRSTLVATMLGYFQVEVLDDPKKIEREDEYKPGNMEGYSAFIHDDFGWMQAKTEELKAFMGPA